MKSMQTDRSFVYSTHILNFALSFCGLLSLRAVEGEITLAGFTSGTGPACFVSDGRLPALIAVKKAACR